MADAAAGTGDVGQMAQPPEMVQANVAITPFCAIDLAGWAGQIGEAVPGIAAAGDDTGAAPITIS